MGEDAVSEDVKVEIQEFGNIIVLVVSGDVHIGNTGQLEEVWDEQLLKKPRVIAIQGRDITFMDSSAIGTLVKFLNQAARIDLVLNFIDLNPSLLKIFVAAKLDKIFTLMSQEEFSSKYLAE